MSLSWLDKVVKLAVERRLCLYAFWTRLRCWMADNDILQSPLLAKDTPSHVFQAVLTVMETMTLSA